MKLRPARIAAIILLLALIFSLPAVAASDFFVDRQKNGIVNCMVECGMLQGTGEGLELDRRPTRIEIAVMLIRALGKDAEAKALETLPCVFTDVPQWAVGYANYAYTSGISVGVGESKFGTDNPATPDEYVTMFLRKLGYSDANGDFSWNESTQFANALGIFQRDFRWAYFSQEKTGGQFSRYDVASGAYYFLGAKYKGSNLALADTLIDEGVLTSEFVQKYGIIDTRAKSFTISAAGRDSLTFEVVKTSLIITGRITSPQRRWISITVRNESTGRREADEIFSAPEEGGEINKVIDIPNDGGAYLVDVYCNFERYGNFSRWGGEDMRIISVGGTASFKKSPVYLRNLLCLSGQGDPAMYLEAENSIEADSPVIAELARNITSGLESDYEKALAIHRYVAETISYDSDFYNDRFNLTTAESALDVLESKKAVCLGYTNLMTALLRSINIPCAYVTGMSPVYGGELTAVGNDENHIWCEVYIDGRWIIADPTWDSANYYFNGKFHIENIPILSYFDPSPEFFSAAHRISTVQYNINADFIGE